MLENTSRYKHPARCYNLKDGSSWYDLSESNDILLENKRKRREEDRGTWKNDYRKGAEAAFSSFKADVDLQNFNALKEKLAAVEMTNASSRSSVDVLKAKFDSPIVKLNYALINLVCRKVSSGPQATPTLSTLLSKSILLSPHRADNECLRKLLCEDIEYNNFSQSSCAYIISFTSYSKSFCHVIISEDCNST